MTLDVAAHNPLTDGRYLSLVSTDCTQCVMGSPRPQVILQVTGSAYNSPALSMSFCPCLKPQLCLFSVSNYCPSRPSPSLVSDSETQTSEETKTVGAGAGVISEGLLPAGAGNIISASRLAGARAAGDKENQAPGDFITSAASD